MLPLELQLIKIQFLFLCSLQESCQLLVMVISIRFFAHYSPELCYAYTEDQVVEMDSSCPGMQLLLKVKPNDIPVNLNLTNAFEGDKKWDVLIKLHIILGFPEIKHCECFNWCKFLILLVESWRIVITSGTVHWFWLKTSFHPLLWTSSGLTGSWKLSAYIRFGSLRSVKSVKTRGNWKPKMCRKVLNLMVIGSLRSLKCVKLYCKGVWKVLVVGFKKWKVLGNWLAKWQLKLKRW